VNPSEIPQLLAEIALADPRVRRDDPVERRGQIKMWAGILAAVPYPDAIRLAHRHYATSQWPILPANIATAWRDEIRDRLERHTDPTPTADPDLPRQWNAELRDSRQAVVAGELPPAPHTAAQGTARPIAALPVGRTVPGPYMPADFRERIGLTERAPELARTCPKPGCKAGPRQPCRTPRGHRRTETHQARKDATDEERGKTA
jgi:hypothetical protein